MTERFTASNRLLLMRLGEGKVTWGTQGVNKVLSLVDDLWDGRAAPAQPALSVAAAAADEARMRTLVCTGPAHVLPDVRKWYHVLNPLGVDCAVSCVASPGTAVPVASGTVGLVLCDGATVISAEPAKGFAAVVVPSGPRASAPLTHYGALYVLRRAGQRVALPEDPPPGYRLTVTNRSEGRCYVTSGEIILADDFLRHVLVTQDGTTIVTDQGSPIMTTEFGQDGNVLDCDPGKTHEFTWSAVLDRWVTLRS